MPLPRQELVDALNVLLDKLGYGGPSRIQKATQKRSISISRIARGESKPSLETWEAIYKAFPQDIPPPRLIPVFGEDTGDPHPEIARLKSENDELRGQLMEKAMEPERDLLVRVAGLAECGLKGWESLTTTTMYSAAPPDIVKQKGFAVIAVGDSMVPAGVNQGHVVFCNPSLEPLIGDIVFVENNEGHATIKLYKGQSEINGEVFTVLQGWLPGNEKHPDRPQKPYTLEVKEDQIQKIAPVIYIKRRP